MSYDIMNYYLILTGVDKGRVIRINGNYEESFDKHTSKWHWTNKMDNFYRGYAEYEIRRAFEEVDHFRRKITEEEAMVIIENSSPIEYDEYGNPLPTVEKAFYVTLKYDLLEFKNYVDEHFNPFFATYFYRQLLRELYHDICDSLVLERQVNWQSSYVFKGTDLRGCSREVMGYILDQEEPRTDQLLPHAYDMTAGVYNKCKQVVDEHLGHYTELFTHIKITLKNLPTAERSAADFDNHTYVAIGHERYVGIIPPEVLARKIAHIDIVFKPWELKKPNYGIHAWKLREHVVQNVDGDVAKTTAWLLNVLENKKVFVQDLIRAGIPSAVIEAILVLKRNEEDNYQQYLTFIRSHAVAKTVMREKMQFLLNIQLRRDEFAYSIKYEKFARYRKYLESLEYLSLDDEQVAAWEWSEESLNW